MIYNIPNCLYIYMIVFNIFMWLVFVSFYLYLDTFILYWSFLRFWYFYFTSLRTWERIFCVLIMFTISWYFTSVLVLIEVNYGITCYFCWSSECPVGEGMYVYNKCVKYHQLKLMNCSPDVISDYTTRCFWSLQYWNFDLKS